VPLEGAVWACDRLLEEAGADWLAVEFDGWLCVEASGDGVFVCVEGTDEEVELEGLVWVWADGGRFLVVSLGDCAKAGRAQDEADGRAYKKLLVHSELLSIDRLRSRIIERRSALVPSALGRTRKNGYRRFQRNHRRGPRT